MTAFQLSEQTKQSYTTVTLLWLSVVFGMFALCLSTGVQAQDHIYLDHFHTPNGTVSSMKYSDDLQTLFIGGEFDAVGPFFPFGARVDSNTGERVPLECGRFQGEIFASVADGNGGWFIGGAFTHVGDSVRHRLAHIDANGALTAWNPGANDDVYVLELKDNALFVSGGFNQLGGVARNFIGALDATNGSVTEWYPLMNGSATDFACVDTVLYVSGTFTTVYGQPQSRVAAFSLSTGALLDWNPVVTGGSVLQIEASDSLVFIGGTFTQVGGVSRFRLAKVSRTTAASIDFPTPNNAVRTLKLAGDTLFAAGDFSTFAGVQRGGIAAVNGATGSLLGWAPQVNDDVFDFALVGDAVLMGGSFTEVQGAQRMGTAAVDRNSAALLPWSPMSPGEVNTLAFSEGNVFVGGDFEIIGAKPRLNLAALDVTTGELTDWVANANDHVRDLELKGDTLFLCGEFFNVQGAARSRLAAVSASTGQLLDWSASLSNQVNYVKAMSLSNNALFISAIYPFNGVTPFDWLQKFDLITGERLQWDASVMGVPDKLLVDGNTVYVAGSFHSANNTSREKLVAFNAQTGELTPWHPVVQGASVSVLHMHEDHLYTNAAAPPSWTRVSQFDTLLGISTAWSTPEFWSCREITSSGNTLYAAAYVFDEQGGYVSGDFNNHHPIWAIDIPSGEVTGFNPFHSSAVNELLAVNDTIYVGGWFSSALSFPRPSLAVFIDPCVSADTPEIGASDLNPCYGYEVVLSVGDASLEDATQWSWYTTGCGTNLVGNGPTLTVVPDSTTTYFVRAEGGCPEPGQCSSVTIEVQEPLTGVSSHEACGSFTWLDGIAYTENTTTAQFNAVGIAATGCDSLLTLHLTIFGAIDDCGVCFELGNSDPQWNLSCADCSGEPYGEAYLDTCDQCVGGNTQLTPCVNCISDVSGDGMVTIEDLSILLTQLGCESDCPFDFNGDGIISTLDLSIFLQEYGMFCN